MNTQTALKLLENITLKVGWIMEATEYGHRFEQSVSVTFSYPAFKSERENWPTYRERVPFAKASYPIMVGNLDAMGLYRKVLECVLDIEEHEWREFLRIHPTGWAPFHPHNLDGMVRWGNMEHDLHFGLT